MRMLTEKLINEWLLYTPPLLYHAHSMDNTDVHVFEFLMYVYCTLLEMSKLITCTAGKKRIIKFI